MTIENSNIKLIPVNQLEYNSDTQQWISLGEDPFFYIEGDYPKGWVKMTVSSSSTNIIPLKIYWDEGTGISEQKSLKIGRLAIGKNIESTFYFHLPLNTQTFRLDPGTQKDQFNFEIKSIQHVSKLSLLQHSYQKYKKKYSGSTKIQLNLINKAFRVYKSYGFKGLTERAKNYLTASGLSQAEQYQEWITLNRIGKQEVQENISFFEKKPCISILMPVYNTKPEFLKKAIDSVRNQLYPNWELCICDDASTDLNLKKIIEEYKTADSRIKVHYHQEQQNISIATNSALHLSTGEYIALLDHDDEITIDALYEVAYTINKFPLTDMIYSDEDKIDIKQNRFSPFFKPDWSPDTLLSQMYTGHLTVYRKSLVEKVGGFRIGFEGSQDYDLALRIVEHTQHIQHISKILYHWRTTENSTALVESAKSYTVEAGLKALKETVIRRGYNAIVETDKKTPNVYIVKHQPINNPLISIIIPTRNMATVLSTCLESIFSLTTYSNFEVIIVDNGSNEKETLELFENYSARFPVKFKVLRLDIPFNYSKLNNMAVAESKGDLILLLNNDVEVISPDWLQDMAGQAQRTEVGAVGAKLLYEDNTIQHSGVILGISGTAGHSHKHFNQDHPGYFSKLRTISNYAAVTGACLMVKKSVFLEVGGLDEDLQVAFNDVDFCLKLLEKNLYNISLPHVKLYHYESKSRGYENTPEKQMRFNKEADYLKNRWSSLLNNDPFYNKNLTKEKEDFSLMI